MLFRSVIVVSLTLSAIVFGATPVPVYAADPVLVGAGDIGNCDTNADEATARLLDEISGTVFTTGDNVYPDGTASQFARCYDPTWGRHKSRTRPTPGNHDYHTNDASGYFDYFGAAAGRRGDGYYSYDLGAWHIIALNSNISMSAGSEQEEWLQADLEANPADCTLAYWHHPRFSSGDHGSSSMPRAVWETLYEAGADVVLNGHDHNYERFAPQTPNGALDRTRGIRQFVVGTGGTNLRDVGSPIANSEVRNDTTHGVLKLTLHATSYEWAFVPVAGRTFQDAGSASCSGATDTPTQTIRPTRTSPPTATPPETATRTATATPSETATGTPTVPPDSTPVPEGCETSSDDWQSRPFEPQHGTFTAEFDATPHRRDMDGVTGLAAGSAAEYDDLAAIVRFNPDGFIDARDGSAYRAVAPIPYTVGTSYRFRLLVRVAEHTYDIFVTPHGGSEQEVGTNFAFRSEQAEVTSLGSWSIHREHGRHTVCDFTVAPVPPATATPTTEWINRLRNAGFELDRDASGRPDSWTTNSRATRSDAEVHDGNYAMQHAATDDKNYKIRQTVNRVTGGQLYTFAGWVNIPDTSDEFIFELQLSWRDADNEIIETTVIQTYTAPTSGWESISASLVAPEGTARATIRMVIKSLNATIYVDDFVFVEGAGPLPADGILPPSGAADSGDAVEPDTEDEPEVEGVATPTLAPLPTRTSPVIAATPTPQILSATPTATNTPTAEATTTAVAITSTPTAMASPTAEPTPSEVATATPTATTTPTPTAMVVPTSAPTPTAIVTPTAEATPTAIVTSTPQMTSTVTATSTPEVPEPTPTSTVLEATPTATSTPTSEATPTTTDTPTPTPMAIPTPELTVTATATSTPEVLEPTPTSGVLEPTLTTVATSTPEALEPTPASEALEATPPVIVTTTSEMLESTPASDLIEPPQPPWPLQPQADLE